MNINSSVIEMCKDVALLGLASMLFRSGMVDEAMVVTILALDNSPDTVAVHFMLANLYAAKVSCTSPVAGCSITKRKGSSWKLFLLHCLCELDSRPATLYNLAELPSLPFLAGDSRI